MKAGTAVRGSLLACAGVSVLAHAALFGYLTLPVGGGGAGPQRAAALQVRVVAQPPVAAVPGATNTAVPATQQLQPEATTGGTSGAPESAPVQAAVEFDEQTYIPRPRLSVVPVPQQPVLLAWPSENAPPAGRYTAVLSLFIDEQGLVQRVRVDGDGLPQALRDQASAAFAGVRYSPGQVEGRDVKSRIRVEVSFEAEAQMLRRGAGS